MPSILSLHQFTDQQTDAVQSQDNALVVTAGAGYLRLEKYEGGVEGAAEAATGYVRAYVAGVREGRFPPTPPTGGCPDHCPAVGFCWQYAPRGW